MSVAIVGLVIVVAPAAPVAARTAAVVVQSPSEAPAADGPDTSAGLVVLVLVAMVMFIRRRRS